MRLPTPQQSAAVLAAAAVVVGLVLVMTRVAEMAFHHEGPFTTVVTEAVRVGPEDTQTGGPAKVLTFLTDSLIHLRSGESGASLEARADHIKGTLNALVPAFAGSGTAPRVVVQCSELSGSPCRLVLRESEEEGWHALLTVTEEDVRLERLLGASETTTESLAQRWTEALQRALDDVASSPVWASSQ